MLGSAGKGSGRSGAGHAREGSCWACQLEPATLGATRQPTVGWTNVNSPDKGGLCALIRELLIRGVATEAIGGILSVAARVLIRRPSDGLVEVLA